MVADYLTNLEYSPEYPIPTWFAAHFPFIYGWFPHIFLLPAAAWKVGCRAVMATKASRWPLGDTWRRPANGFLVGRFNHWGILTLGISTIGSTMALKTYSTKNWHREQKVGNTPAQLATKDGDRNWKNGARTNMEIGPNTCWSSYPPKNGRCSFHCSNLNVGQLVCFLQLGSVGPHSPMNPRYHGIHIFIDLPMIASPPNFTTFISRPRFW